jgi:phage-related protein
MKNLGIQMGELKESIGQAVAPLIEKLLPKFLEFSNWIQKNKGLVVTLGAVIGGLAVAIIAVNTAMKVWTAVTKAYAAVQKAFNAVMGMNPIFLIAIAIAAIVAILIVLQQKFNIFGVAIEAIGKAFSAVWDAIKTVFSWVVDNWPLLLAILTGPFGLVILAVVTFKDQIINFLGNLIGWIGTAFKAVLDLIMWPFKKAYEGILFFKDNVIKVFNGLKDLAGKIFEGIGGAFKGVINAVISGLEGGLNFAIKGLNIILDGIDKAAGPWVNFGEIPNVKLPRLAEGGIVSSPTIAMIGEGGEPEAIIPLSKLASMGFGGNGGPTVNITVTSADPNAVVAALQRYVRMSGPVPVTTRPL